MLSHSQEIEPQDINETLSQSEAEATAFRLMEEFRMCLGRLPQFQKALADEYLKVEENIGQRRNAIGGITFRKGDKYYGVEFDGIELELRISLEPFDVSIDPPDAEYLSITLPFQNHLPRFSYTPRDFNSEDMENGDTNTHLALEGIKKILVELNAP